MLTKLKNRKEGFTIIEVLIVLAIAGLILLVVFLAVPALQRNSRNTQRKDDVSRLLGAVQEVVNNNNGSITSITNANVVTAAGTLAYYQTSGTNPTIGSGAQANGTTVDTVVIRTSAKCGTGTGANDGPGDAVAGTARQIAILYRIEENVEQCTSS